MRKAAALILTAVILFLFVIEANAFTISYDGLTEEYPWDPIVLVVDGNVVETKEMPPIILNSRTMVPAREFFEQLGAKVAWDNDSRRVIIDYDDEQIILTIDSYTVFIGNHAAIISPEDPAPKIINNKTMIPVRFVAEEFGFKVEWINDTRTVKITSPNEEIVSLSDVEFSTSDDADTIFIQMEEFVNPAVFKLEDPDRIVIDVYSATFQKEDGSIEVNGQAVKKIRYSQHDNKFRVVADLYQKAEYEIFKLKNGIEVQIIKTEEITEEPTNEPSEEVTEIVTEGKDYNGYVIVVDAGHGGTDPGAIYPIGSSNPEAREKDFTLDIAKRVKANLEKAGIEIVMTRDGDTYPTLKERVEIANNSGADLYVSIHINAMDNKDHIDGAQVYYFKGSEEGNAVATAVYNRLVQYTGMTKRGVQNGSSLYVIKNTTMPSILTECGFITNKKDREYLKTNEGIQQIANAISDGVLEAIDSL